jgi:hexosaminidase
MKSRLIVIVSWLWAMTGLAATPSIIPLPKQITVMAGTFTLCPKQPNPPVPGHAVVKILVDASSLPTGQYLAAMLYRSTDYQFQILTVTNTAAVRGAILITTSNSIASLGAEGYELTVAPDSVVIRAPGSAGGFYGVQSLLQLLPPQALSLHAVSGVAWVAPCVYIQDQPRFSWRGYMMDEARHFFGKVEVKKFLDALALQKMNTFHWHLVDDTGWRIQITNYPNLTTVGAWRPGWGTAQNNGIDFGQNPRVASTCTNGAGYYGGFYSQADIKEIVAYATQRHINIVPEIEMPAHCTSALISYPQFGCGNASNAYVIDINSTQNVNYLISLYSLNTNTTIPFLQEVLTEVMGLFPGQYIHCGGDEVVATDDMQWTNIGSVDRAQMTSLGIDPTTGDTAIVAYQHWFSTNMAAFLLSHGRTMVGWTEFEAGGTVTNAVCMDWNSGGTTASLTASNGQKVVVGLNAGTYINYYMYTNGQGSQEYPPGEPYYSSKSYNSLAGVYGFEPVPSGLAAQYQSNILGTQCEEWAEYIPSPINEEFKAFPRLCAIAEVGWTPAASKNITDFTNRLVVHEQRLAAMGMNYDRTNANATAIGTWGPTMPTSQTNISFTITPYVTNSGDINLDFHYTSGADALNIYSVTLYVNGVAADSDNTGYIGYAGLSASNLPFFVLHLPTYVPGATYAIQATVAGYGGTATSGTVYMVNWN